MCSRIFDFCRFLFFFFQSAFFFSGSYISIQFTLLYNQLSILQCIWGETAGKTAWGSLETVLLKPNKFHIYFLFLCSTKQNECISICNVLNHQTVVSFYTTLYMNVEPNVGVLNSLVSFSSQAFMSVSKLLIKNERDLPLQKTTKVQKSSEVEPPSHPLSLKCEAWTRARGLWHGAAGK